MLDREQFLRLTGAVAGLAGFTAVGGLLSGCSQDGNTDGTDTPIVEPDWNALVADLVSGMSLDEKLSQMLIPAMRNWEGIPATDLSAAPGLAEVLRRHQLGGLILFDSNTSDTAQTTRLISDLQTNNAQVESMSVHVPYFVSIDQEGGSIVRLAGGTRMTGSMAIAATDHRAVSNAHTTGRIIGEELAALGFNVDFAPSLDVNSNPANPIIGTRSFSDNPDTVAELGIAFVNGLSEQGIVAVLKHFPGHGDTAEDSHTGAVLIEKTLEDLERIELAPFRAAIDAGAEMIMTAHITLPFVEEETVLGDGQTTGHLPATMSERIISGLLRDEMGFDGVVVTDALEMDAICETGLVPGAPYSAEYGANVAERAINAGVDLLLIPVDLTDYDSAAYLDDYLGILARKVMDGTVDEARIDDSAIRILALKAKHGILEIPQSDESDSESDNPDSGSDNPDSSDGGGSDNPDNDSDNGSDEHVSDTDTAIANAWEIVGCEANHDVEAAIARQAVTLLKNDGALPIPTGGTHTVFVGREPDDAAVIMRALVDLQEKGAIPADAFMRDLVTGEVFGAEESACRMSVGVYLVGGYPDISGGVSDAIASANTVVGLSCMFGLESIQDGSYQFSALSSLIAASHGAGARFVLLSSNLPYDAARYQDADALVLAYMGEGMSDAGSPNANVPAAVQHLFEDDGFHGVLPVNIFDTARAEDGRIVFSDAIIFPRGFGME